MSPYLNILPLPATEIPKPQRLVLRDHSIKIWNSCNSVSADNTDARADLAKLRAFAYLLLGSAISHNVKRMATTVNLFKNALIAGRACLRANMFDLADKVMQNEAVLEVLNSKRKQAHDDQDTTLSFVIEYYCLRTLLEWKRKRSDLAEYWYKRMSELDFGSQECDVERIVDLFYEIGRDCLSHNDSVDVDNAAKWLERAQCILDRKEYCHSFTGSDLRLNVMHSFGECFDDITRTRLLTVKVQALIRLPGNTHEEQAWHILNELRSEYGSKLPILLLTLEVICARPGPDFDSNTFAKQLQEIVRSVHLIDANHRLVMYYIHKLHTQSRFHALTCIKAYVLQRLIPEEMIEWKEQTIVDYIAMVSENQAVCSTAELQTLEQDLTQFAEASKSELSPSAAQAAHVLI